MWFHSFKKKKEKQVVRFVIVASIGATACSTWSTSEAFVFVFHPTETLIKGIYFVLRSMAVLFNEPQTSGRWHTGTQETSRKHVVQHRRTFRYFSEQIITCTHMIIPGSKAADTCSHMIIPGSKAADTRVYKYQQLYSQELICYFSEQSITFTHNFTEQIITSTQEITPGSKAADTHVHGYQQLYSQELSCV